MKWIAATLIILYAQSASDNQIELEYKLQGTWVYKYATDEVVYLRRARKLKHGKYGFQLRDNRELVIMQSDTWCGTEKSTFEPHKGRWAVTKDSILVMEYAQKKDSVKYDVHIDKVDHNTIIIR